MKRTTEGEASGLAMMDRWRRQPGARLWVIALLAGSLLMACGTESGDDAPPPPPQTPETPPAPSVQGGDQAQPSPASGASEHPGAAPARPTATTHCGNHEVFFSCMTEEDGKVLSVCGKSEGRNRYVQYFFGPIGEPEFVWPRRPNGTDGWTFVLVTQVRSEGHALSFSTRRGTRFEVRDVIGAAPRNEFEQNNFEGVRVLRNEQVRRSISCEGPVTRNWEGLVGLFGEVEPEDWCAMNPLDCE